MAGGQWRLPLPTGSRAVAVAAGASVPFFPDLAVPVTGSVPTPQNLLAVDRPSLLTEWDLEAIAVPGQYVKQNVADDLILTLRLILNRSIVWQQAQVVIAGSPIFGQLNFYDSFVNPITVKCGDALQVDFLAYSVIGTTVTGALNSQGGTLGNAGGNVTYEVHEIPGRRRL